MGPVRVLSRVRMLPSLRQWLSLIPASILSSIIAAELVGKPALTGSGISISLLAAAVATLIGALSRSLFATVIAGMAAFMGLSYLLA